jgi:hypothetical protein
MLDLETLHYLHYIQLMGDGFLTGERGIFVVAETLAVIW